MTNLYGNRDPRDIPSYSISDAARYLRIPSGTIRSWIVGRKYPVVDGSKTFHPLIPVKKTKPALLSFTNLVEVHVLRAIRKDHKLERIEPDDSGLAVKLYPFTRSKEENNPRLVVIDSRIAFGRLVIAETGIPTSILAERYHAGDSIENLAKDYNCSPSTIEEAIRCELPLAA